MNIRYPIYEGVYRILTPDIEPADAFIYRNESFTLYSREELERLVGILHGELFNGFRPGRIILWAYRMEWRELPT